VIWPGTDNGKLYLGLKKFIKIRGAKGKIPGVDSFRETKENAG